MAFDVGKDCLAKERHEDEQLASLIICSTQKMATTRRLPSGRAPKNAYSRVFGVSCRSNGRHAHSGPGCGVVASTSGTTDSTPHNPQGGPSWKANCPDNSSSSLTVL